MKYCIIYFLFPFLVYAQNQKGASPKANTQSRSLETNSATYAVVVGISDYQDKDIPDLRFADKDAEAFANFLRSPAGGSLNTDHLKVLLNKQATMAQFANALDWLMENAKENDQAIVYFSGHGDVEKKTLTQPGFLLCWDAPARVYMAGGAFALPMLQEVISTLSIQTKAKVVVILDACRAGKLAGSSVGGAQATAANLSKQFANEVKMLSCQPNEYSIEGEQWGGGRGAFSFNLVNSLYGLADANQDLVVTLQEVGRYLEDHVTAEVAPVNQMPMVLGNRNEKIAIVDPSILAAFQTVKANQMAMLSAIDTRGIEEDVLGTLDSTTLMIYKLFKKSLEDQVFLEPATQCSEAYYQLLMAEPRMKRLHSTITRNYAAALQEEAQQTLNFWLKVNLTKNMQPGSNQKTPFSKVKVRIQSFSKYLERAAELLGNKHYMYKSLMARKYFFEGYLLANTHNNPDKNLGEMALAHFRQSLKWEPDQPHVYWQMSRVFGHNLPEPDSVEHYTQAAINLYPSWIKPKVEGAFLLFENFNRWSKAQVLLDQAIQIDSTSDELFNVLSLYNLKQNKFETAEHYIKKAISLDSTDGFYWYNFGATLKSKGEWEKAIHAVKTAIQLDSAFAPAWRLLGNLYTKTNRLAETEQPLLKSVALDPMLYNGYVDLGKLYFQTNRINEAETSLKKAISLDEKEGQAHFELGFLYSRTKRFPEAKQQYEKAISCDTTNKFYWLDFGSLYLEYQQYDKAIEIYKKSISIDSTYNLSYNQLGYAYLATSNFILAEQALKKAIFLDSTLANPNKHLGMVYYKTNRMAESRKCIQKALSLNPKYAAAYIALACLDFSEGKLSESLENIEKAIANGLGYMQLIKDEELTLLCEKPEWKTIMKKHFPDKFKD